MGQPGKPSKEQFARLMEEALHQTGDEAKFRYEPNEFRLIGTGKASDDVGVFHLTNAYAEYCAASPERKPAVVRRFVRSWLSRHKDIPEEFEDARVDLLPVLRSRSFFELLLLQLKEENRAKLQGQYRPLAEHFGVGLAYDLPETIRILLPDQWLDWKVTFEDALAAAMTNLSELSQEPFENPAPGVWMSPWRDNYDAARLLLPDLIRSLPVRGNPIAIAPNRDTLLVSGSEDEPGLGRLADLAEQAMQAPRPLEGIALRLVGDDWQPYLPPADHPHRHRFQSLWVQSMSQNYADQKELLEKWFEQKQESVFVASFTVLRRKDTGLVTNYSVWSEGVDTLLPKTDLVFLIGTKGGSSEGEIVAHSDWDRVCQVAGHLMVRTDLYPERYRVKEFPNEEQLAAIGKKM